MNCDKERIRYSDHQTSLRTNSLPFEAQRQLFFSSLFGTVCGVVDIVHLLKKEASSQPVHWTECPFRPVNWIDENEERCYDGGM